MIWFLLHSCFVDVFSHQTGRSLLRAGHPPERPPDAGRNPQVPARRQANRGPRHPQAAVSHPRRLGRTFTLKSTAVPLCDAVEVK